MALNYASADRSSIAIALICATLFALICAAPFANQAYAETDAESQGTTEVVAQDEGTPVVSYNLWIGGTQVTSENASDVLKDGTVSYDPDSATLTLSGASITKEDPEHGALIYANLDNLTVKCVKRSGVSGSSLPRTEEPAIYSTGNLNIKTSAKLWANTGIVADGTVTIENDDQDDSFAIETERIYSLHGDVVFNNVSAYITPFRNRWHAIYAGSSFVFNGSHAGINFSSFDGDDAGSAIFARKSVAFNDGLLYCINNGDGSVVDCGSSNGPGTISFGKNIKPLCYETDDYGWVGTRKVGNNTYACIVWKDGMPTQETSIAYIEDKNDADASSTGISSSEQHSNSAATVSNRSSNGTGEHAGYVIAWDLEQIDELQTSTIPNRQIITLAYAASAVLTDRQIPVEVAIKGGAFVAALGDSIDFER